MMTKYDANKVNNDIADIVHKYIADGYRIDCKDSVITNEDKDCTFKAVLTKDVDGIECKVKITLSETGDDSNKTYTYHKVDTVGDTKWSEETRSYSSSTSTKDDANKKITSAFVKSSISGPHKADPTKYSCKCPSAFTRLDDVIKVPKKDAVTVNSDKKKVPIEDLYDKKAPDYKYGVYGILNDWFNKKQDTGLLSLIRDFNDSFNALRGNHSFESLLDLWRDYRFLDKACDEWMSRSYDELDAGKDPTYKSFYDYVRSQIKDKAADIKDHNDKDTADDDKKIDEIVDKVHTDKKETKSDNHKSHHNEDPAVDRIVSLIRSLL